MQVAEECPDHQIVIDMKTHKVHCSKCGCGWKKISLTLEGYHKKGENGCDLCGKIVDERSMEVIQIHKQDRWLCQSCGNNYTIKELSGKFEKLGKNEIKLGLKY